MRALILLALCLASPAAAETRGYTITGFDKIRVAGPFTINLRTGAGPSARAEGPARAIDQLRIEVRGTTLVVSSDRNDGSGWQEGNPGAITVDITTPGLSSVILSGSGALKIDRVRAPRFDLAMTGSGDVSIGALTTDRLTITMIGSGKATIAGKAAQASARVEGSGSIAGAGLTVTDLDVTVNGSGDVRFAATRAAKVNSSGAGNIIVAGNPSCTVRATGSGEVRCGRGG